MIAVHLASPPALSTCRSCQAAIIWGLTEYGRRMPLDAQPTADGTCVDVDGVQYASHFATCPNAASHRKARR